MSIKPIETEYKGYIFRSRLEARFAIFLDYLGIKWLYEHEGFDMDGIWYLPDFYIPDSDLYFEVKGTSCWNEMSKEDQEKVLAFHDNGKDILVVFSDFTFCGTRMAEAGGYMPREFMSDPCSSEELAICRCSKCGRLYTIDFSLGWECKKCGFWDGGRSFDLMDTSDHSSYYRCIDDAMNAAKHARFEHRNAKHR